MTGPWSVLAIGATSPLCLRDAKKDRDQVNQGHVDNARVAHRNPCVAVELTSHKCGICCTHRTAHPTLSKFGTSCQHLLNAFFGRRTGVFSPFCSFG